VSGHLNPATTLARALVARGHRVTLFAHPDAETKARAAGLGFVAVGAAAFPPGSIARHAETLGRLDGWRAVAFTLNLFRRSTAAFLEDGSARIADAGLDLLLVDEVSPAGEAIAEQLGLPFVTLCHALALAPDPALPPAVVGWRYRAGRAARLRNRAAAWALEQVGRPFGAELRRYRAAHGLPPSPDAARLATIAQQPAFFDFPRARQPPTFHHTGPFHDDASGDATDFPFERLDGRPLVYASMGTLQNREEAIFRAIAEACVGLDVQLVVTLGRKGAALREPLPGAAIVVPYAPQRRLLARAAAFVTHAGLNSALEALVQGVPMVAIPISNDQPAVASRLARLGAAEVVPLRDLEPGRVRRALDRVLGEPSFRAAARDARARLAALDGLARAADLVEAALAAVTPAARDAGARSR
jgi:MGT family glycosyltransferase